MERKTRSRLVLLSTVLVLFLGSLVFKDIIWSRLPSGASTPFLAVTRQSVTGVQILDAGRETDLYNRKGTWYLKRAGVEYLADQVRVNALLDAVFSFKKGDVYSTNKKNHRELGIDKQRIVIRNDKGAVTVYVGSAYTLSQRYIRFATEDEVYAGEGFDDAFTSPDYRDLALHLVTNPEQVSRISYESPQRSSLYEKTKNDWQADGVKLAREKMDFFLNDIQSLKAADIEPKSRVQLPDRAFSLTVQEAGVSRAAVFFAKDETEYFMTVNDGPLVYTVKSGLVESLKKTPEDLQ